MLGGGVSRRAREVGKRPRKAPASRRKSWEAGAEVRRLGARPGSGGGGRAGGWQAADSPGRRRGGRSAGGRRAGRAAGGCLHLARRPARSSGWPLGAGREAEGGAASARGRSPPPRPRQARAGRARQKQSGPPAARSAVAAPLPAPGREHPQHAGPGLKALWAGERPFLHY